MITLTEEELDFKQQHSMVAGTVAENKRIVAFLMEAAADWFKSGNDDLAGVIRTLSNKIEDFGKGDRKDLQRFIEAASNEKKA